LRRSLKRRSSQKGAAFIDVIRLVTFNHHAGSTESFDYVHGRNIAANVRSATLDLARIAGQIGTGLIDIDDDANELPKILGANDRPLNELPERELCPRSKLLAAVYASLR
jgi:hypothetical protein